MLPERTVSVRYQPSVRQQPEQDERQQREGQRSSRASTSSGAPFGAPSPGASSAHETYLLVAVRWVPVKA